MEKQNIDPIDDAYTIIKIQEDITEVVSRFNFTISQAKQEYEKISARKKHPLLLSEFIKLSNEEILEIPQIITEEDFEKFKLNFIENLHEYYINNEEQIYKYCEILINILSRFAMSTEEKLINELETSKKMIIYIYYYHPQIDNLEEYTIYTNNYIKVIENILQAFFYL